MAEALRGWIASIICTAAFCALAICLTPKGRVLSAVKLICGAAMILAMFDPLINLDFKEYSSLLTKYNDNAVELTSDAESYSDKLNRLYIQDGCCAYILDKAKNIGADVASVSVIAEWSTEGFWYPVSAKIEYCCTEDMRNELSGIIEAELGIAKGRQAWTYVGA